MTPDEIYMLRCVQLARQGAGHARPNPMVGAVVVCDGRIIGEGYHRACGGPHAEVHAIGSVKHRELLSRSTIYVSLEPCAHYGKTPPCAELIIRSGLRRVVVGTQDPFAKVNGLGITMLREAGIEVTVGVMESECRELNKVFFTYHTLSRPFILLKWAADAQGLIHGHVSTPTTQAISHRLRAEADAILVGGRTAVVDNPSLTTRYWAGKNPTRVVVDTRGTLPPTLRLFDDQAPTLTYGGDLRAMLADMHRRGLQSLIVEGGAQTLQRFIDAGLWDEARIERSPLRLCSDTPEPKLTAASLIGSETIGQNTITRYRPERRAEA